MDWTESEFKKKIVITIIIIITIYLEDYPLVPGTERFVAKKSIFEKKNNVRFLGCRRLLVLKRTQLLSLKMKESEREPNPGRGKIFSPSRRFL